MNYEEFLMQKQNAIIEKGFDIADLPYLIDQFYSWHIYKSIFLIILSIAIVAILFNPIKNSIGRIKKDEDDCLDAFLIAWLLIAFIWIIIFVMSIYDLIFIIIAPDIYIIERF